MLTSFRCAEPTCAYAACPVSTIGDSLHCSTGHARSLTAVAPRGSAAPGAARHGRPGAPKARGPTAGRHQDHPPSLWGRRPGLAGAAPSAFVQRPRQQATLLLPPRSAAPTPLPGCPLTSTPRLHQTRTRRNPDLPNRAIRAGRRTSRAPVWERERVSVESKGCYSVALKVVLRVCQGCSNRGSICSTRCET